MIEQQEHRTNWKKQLVFFIFTLFVLALVLTGCGDKDNESATTDDSSEPTEEFVVGMEGAYAPYNWTQADYSDTAVPIDGGQYVDGYDVQIARRIADKLSKKLVIKKIAWEGLILSLQTHQIDAIVAGMSPTPERAEQINFSDIYYINTDAAFGVVVQKGGPLADASTINDFSGAKITSQVGTYHGALLDQLVGVNRLEDMKDFPTMTIALQSGEIDGFVADNGTGRSINANNPDLVYLPLVGDEGFQLEPYMNGVAVGVNKDNPELVTQINDALATISTDEREELMDAAVNYGAATETSFFKQVGEILKNNYKSLVKGTWTTLFISLTATVIGFLIALFVAIVRQSKVGDIIARIYITIFRGTPMMVQAMVIFYGASMLFDGFQWSNLPYGNTVAGIIVVSINTGAYMAETIRSGINGLDKGQFEAAQSLGFSKWQTMFTIILPQAVRSVIPALSNELVVNVKDTSVLNIIAITELFFVSNGIASSTYLVFQTFIITSAIYLFLTIVLTALLKQFELFWDRSKQKPSSYPASVSDNTQFAPKN